MEIGIVEFVDKKILCNQLPWFNNGVIETGGMAAIVGAGLIHGEPRGFGLNISMQFPCRIAHNFKYYNRLIVSASTSRATISQWWCEPGKQRAGFNAGFHCSSCLGVVVRHHDFVSTSSHGNRHEVLPGKSPAYQFYSFHYRSLRWDSLCQYGGPNAGNHQGRYSGEPNCRS